MVSALNARVMSGRNKYIAAVIATTLIFVLGLLLGIVIDQQKLAYVEQVARNQEVEFNSLQVQYLYLSGTNQTNTCTVIGKTLENNLDMLQPVLEQLLEYDKNKLEDAKYDNLKRNYILANIRYNLLAQKSKTECGTDLVRVLYFYKNECKICGDQGYLLSSMKSSLQEKLLVFPIDAGFTKEPMVSVLLKQYNVTEYPTLIIEEKKYTRLQDKSMLLSEICPLYKEKLGMCSGYEDVNTNASASEAK